MSDNAAVAEILKGYDERVNRQRPYQSEIWKKLKASHAKPAGAQFPLEEWRRTYEEVATFLAATLVSYHFQLDQGSDTIRGPNLSNFPNPSIHDNAPKRTDLGSYFEHREISIDDDIIPYLERLVSQKVRVQTLVTAYLPPANYHLGL